jgi:hypothetical protein
VIHCIEGIHRVCTYCIICKYTVLWVLWVSIIWAMRVQTIKCNACKTHQLALFPTTRTRESIYKGTSTRTPGNETYQDTRPHLGSGPKTPSQDLTSWRTQIWTPDPDRDPGPRIGTPDPGSGPRTPDPGRDPRIQDVRPPDP